MPQPTPGLKIASLRGVPVYIGRSWPIIALVIVALIPLSLKGVAYRSLGAAAMLRRNLLVYGVGGVIAPFVGIKLIDLVLSVIPGVK